MSARSSIEGDPLLRLVREDLCGFGGYASARTHDLRGEIWLNLGRTLAKKGSHEEAREAFRRALALNPLLADQVPAGAVAGR